MATKGRQRKRTEPANEKNEAGMRGFTEGRVVISKELDARGEKIAQREGRTKKRQYGIWIERLLELVGDDDQKPKLRELGLLSPAA